MMIKKMENDKKISDYSIPNEATLNLLEDRNIYSEITIKPPIGRPLEIEITRSTTIKEIKDVIFWLRGIPQSKQIIIPYNKEPVNDYSNALNVIHEYFTADVKYVVKKTKKILIRSFKYGYIQLLVDENDTIDDIKYEAGCKICFNYDDPDSSELIFAGIKLENDRKIKRLLTSNRCNIKSC